MSHSPHLPHSSLVLPSSASPASFLIQVARLVPVSMEEAAWATPAPVRTKPTITLTHTSSLVTTADTATQRSSFWLLSHKKEWNYAMCSNMGGPRDYHTKSSQSDRERQVSHNTYMWNLKYDTKELIYKKQKQTNRHRKQTYVYQRGKGARDKLGVTYIHYCI